MFLSGHLEWWECLNMYKMHSISYMEPKVQLFFWHLEPENAWFDKKPLFICNNLPLNLCVRKVCIHNSLKYQNRQDTFWDMWKNARGGDLLFWLSVYAHKIIDTRISPKCIYRGKGNLPLPHSLLTMSFRSLALTPSDCEFECSKHVHQPRLLKLIADISNCSHINDFFFLPINDFDRSKTKLHALKLNYLLFVLNSVEWPIDTIRNVSSLIWMILNDLNDLEWSTIF